MAPKNEYVKITIPPLSSLPSLRNNPVCSICGYDTPTSSQECAMCRAAQHVTSVRIYSISTTQYGREEDYGDFLSCVTRCGGRVTSPLVKSALPEVTSPTQDDSKKEQKPRKSKHVVSGQDLADLMSSLDSAGDVKTELTQKEMNKWLHDGITLRPHQLIGVAWMDEVEKSKYGGGIVADEMGMVTF